MLLGAASALSRRAIDYLLVSTHSQQLHQATVDILAKAGYRVEVSSDFDEQTTSSDGFVFASSPDVDPLFRGGFRHLGRVEICTASPEAMLGYLKDVTSSRRGSARAA